jgi:acetoacetate decarboxylase
MRKGIGIKEISITLQIYRKLWRAHLIAFVSHLRAVHLHHLVPKPFFFKKPLNQHSILVFIRDSMPDGTGTGTYP